MRTEFQTADNGFKFVHPRLQSNARLTSRCVNLFFSLPWNEAGYLNKLVAFLNSIHIRGSLQSNDWKIDASKSFPTQWLALLHLHLRFATFITQQRIRKKVKKWNWENRRQKAVPVILPLVSIQVFGWFIQIDGKLASHVAIYHLANYL